MMLSIKFIIIYFIISACISFYGCSMSKPAEAVYSGDYYDESKVAAELPETTAPFCIREMPIESDVQENYIYESVVVSELPETATPFCVNKIPLSDYYMVMCEDSSDPIGYSAYVKDGDKYTKVNLLFPDTLTFDDAELLAMPSGGGGSGEDTLCFALTVDGERKYVIFTTNFAGEYWWNYEYQGEIPISDEEIEQSILVNQSVKAHGE